ncbi:MAG: hypothetical protein J5678_07585 [Bacteroidaceae bacterium]|nr:hypothetical protein [Bacteroidaceae bacterium]
MRKFLKYAYVGAIALTGFGLASCSSDEDIDNPNGGATGETVKTTFAISFPENVIKTKQTAEIVQQAGTIASFRGMENIVLVPYLDATDRATRFGKNITLLYNTQAIPTSSTNAENAIPNGKLLANSNAVLFNDVTVPLRTSGFLFYGKATGDDGYANGKLTVAGMGNADEITAKSFTPTPIVDAVTSTKGEALATYVSLIAAAKDASNNTWAACADPANNTIANQDWYNANLGVLYTNFTSMKAGASQYVQAAVQDLYSSIYASTNPVAVAIKTAIKTTTYADDSNDDGVLEFTAAINNYPEGDNNDMPAGAAALTWSGATPNVATAVAANTNNSMTVNMATVAYPASLWYFVDSQLKTANASKKDEYDGVQNWSTILGKYTDGTSVTPSTRSIAIEKPIQYAVGRLDSKVNKLTESKYYDREGQEVNIASGFTFTGVLIGGQKAVDYKFEPITTGTPTEYTIYDKTINTSTNGSATLAAATDAGTNYTLALETVKDAPVYVALEFVNNGNDFRGIDGIVKKGCKFYMIAQLDPTAASGVTNKANTDGKVFKQDFNTIATFTIDAGAADANHDGVSDDPKGFANAYVTIPDLRTPMLELGFSVDLEWQEGITFTQHF